MCAVYIFIIYLIFCVCVCVFLHIDPYTICVQESVEIKRNIRSSGTGDTGVVSCQVNGGNWTWVLSKSHKYS